MGRDYRSSSHQLGLIGTSPQKTLLGLSTQEFTVVPTLSNRTRSRCFSLETAPETGVSVVDFAIQFVVDTFLLKRLTFAD